MKCISIMLTLITLMTTYVWTPEPTPGPEIKEIAVTSIVGNKAVFLIDHEEMEAKKGSDVDITEIFPVESHIEDWQFYLEMGLRSKELPKGTKTIGRYAFARSGLKSITIPYGTTEIGYAAFYHCDNLKEVDIPATVTQIDGKAFQFTSWLEDFYRGENDDESDFLIVGDGILLAYRGDAETVIIPEGVKTIAEEAFLNHKEIKEVVFSSTISKIEEDAFKGCDIKPAE
ncbi:MAG: leucine-rich repeat domain-containing protein [Lachnospiraceae bacterium]|nr:leucine-rich repeat domain-containing protein [Lachnospiraceae bacterium]